MHVLNPPCGRNFMPPLFYTPPPTLGWYFQGWGGVWNLSPIRASGGSFKNTPAQNGWATSEIRTVAAAKTVALRPAVWAIVTDCFQKCLHYGMKDIAYHGPHFWAMQNEFLADLFSFVLNTEPLALRIPDMLSLLRRVAKIISETLNMPQNKCIKTITK